MIKHTVIPDIMGTRAGYEIRFTCPVCKTENAIINRSPRDHFKETRDATCKQCRNRSRVVTPCLNRRPASPTA